MHLTLVAFFMAGGGGGGRAAGSFRACLFRCVFGFAAVSRVSTQSSPLHTPRFHTPPLPLPLPQMSGATLKEQQAPCPSPTSTSKPSSPPRRTPADRDLELMIAMLRQAELEVPQRPVYAGTGAGEYLTCRPALVQCVVQAVEAVGLSGPHHRVAWLAVELMDRAFHSAELNTAARKDEFLLIALARAPPLPPPPSPPDHPSLYKNFGSGPVWTVPRSLKRGLNNIVQKRVEKNCRRAIVLGWCQPSAWAPRTVVIQNKMASKYDNPRSSRSLTTLAPLHTPRRSKTTPGDACSSAQLPEESSFSSSPALCFVVPAVLPSAQTAAHPLSVKVGYHPGSSLAPCACPLLR